MFGRLCSFFTFYPKFQFLSPIGRVGTPLRSDFDHMSIGCLFKIISNTYPIQFKNLVTTKRIEAKNLPFCTKTDLSKESSQ
jgi:hypothetical protein